MSNRDLPRIGPYESPRFITAGGMAEVYEADDPDLPGRTVAIKLLNANAATGDELRKFIREGTILSKIQHQNVVQIFRSGRDSGTGRYYFSMTFVDGGNLLQRLRKEQRAREGGLSVREVQKIFLGVLSGLEEIHKLGFVHRDIKPSNVLLRRDGVPVLADLGIARVLPEAGLDQSTRLDSVWGTPEYMPPEQFQHKETKATDVYAMGLSLYFVVTGHEVLPGVKREDINGHLHTRLGAGKELSFELRFPRRVPKRLRRIITKACQLRPENRYPDATAMREALVQPLDLRRLLLLISLAILLGFGVVYGARQVWNRREAERLGQIAVALDLEASSAVERTRQMERAPAPDLLERVDGLLGDAREYRLDAEGEIDGGRFEGARSFLSSALKRYAKACAELGASFGPQVDAAVRLLHEKLENLRRSGAEDIVPTEFEELEERIAALGPPDPDSLPDVHASLATCALASAQIARVEGVGPAQGLAERVESKLGQGGLELASGARAEALAAERSARAAPVAAKEYEDEIAAGATALRGADESLERRAFAAARQGYERAAARFREASAISPAARARAEAGALLDRGESAPEALARAKTLIAEAVALYAERDWGDAEARYEKAVSALEEGRAQNALEQQAIAARDKAGQAREEALQQGAAASAPATFAEGDASRAEGAGALAASKFVEATESFDAAGKRYQVAAQEAAAAVEIARGVERDAQARRRRLLADRECAELRTPKARADCEAGVTEFAGASERLRARDAPAATAGFEHGLALLKAAVDAEPPNRAPKLSLTPATADLAPLTTGQSLVFRASASDPDGDRPSTLFRLDGQRVAQGESYAFVAGPQGRYELEVVATDAAGATASARRTLEVRSPSPPPVASKKTWKGALQRYAEALESKEMAQLEEVWELPSTSLYWLRWNSIFKKPDPIDVTLSNPEVLTEGPDTVAVTFDQEESVGGKHKRYKYQAVLEKDASSGDWRIVENRLLGK